MPVPVQELSRLFPLESLRLETREHLAREAVVGEFQRNENVFEAGDLDEDTIYLLEGELRCVYPDGRNVAHVAGQPHARYSLNDAVPRRFTAKVASARAKVLRIDRRYLEKVITWDQLGRDGAHPHAGAGGNDWVFRLLKAPAFVRLPTGNIEKMFQMFEPVTVKPSEIVMREGDPADYFYVVRSGAASVSKYLDGAPQVVAYLREGDTFGEDALLSNLPRNATVRMMQGGQLMRLSREAFEAVLKPPMLSWVLPADAARQVQAGAALLDVRMPEEHAQRAIDGSINVPLYRLREDIAGVLAPGAKVVVYCNTGERSAAAAFVLKRMGYEVSALHGGLGAMLRQLAASAPA